MSFSRAFTVSTIAVSLTLSAVALTAPAASAAPAQQATKCADESATKGVIQKDTARYRMALMVGGPEDMYTPKEVAAKNITEGEVIVNGDMPPMDMSMPMGRTRHVEVAICDLSTGKTVTGGNVKMAVGSTGGRFKTMPVMEMRGLDEPTTMSHYGNNVSVPKGTYRVKVTVNGNTAVFNVKK